jgi:hypothetical protein
MARYSHESTINFNCGSREAVGQIQGHLLVSAGFHDGQVASAVKDASRAAVKGASHEAVVEEGQRSPLMSHIVAGLSTSGQDTGLELGDTLSCQELVGTLSYRDSNWALVHSYCGFEERHQVVRMVQLLEDYLATQQMQVVDRLTVVLLAVLLPGLCNPCSCHCEPE